MLSREPRLEDETADEFEARDAAFWQRVDEANGELAVIRARIQEWAGKAPKHHDIIAQGRRI